ncbi:MAG: DNA repair protein RadC [Clostridiales bacterium]|nr:DNA repair protein RadC [Clostridiales bacterium]
MSGGLHEDHRRRVRERYIREGLDAFEDHQILELLLFYCVPRRDTNEMAHKMIQAFGSLGRLWETPPSEIQKQCGVSEAAAVLISMVPALARRYRISRWNQREPINDPAAIGEYAVALFMGRTKEAVYLFCLDARRRLIHTALISEGTLNESAVYIREIAAAALRHNSSKVILSHNHPGSSDSPSNADIEATRAVMHALDALDIDLLDHIVVAGDDYFSFAARGLLGMSY